MIHLKLLRHPPRRRHARAGVTAAAAGAVAEEPGPELQSHALEHGLPHEPPVQRRRQPGAGLLGVGESEDRRCRVRC